MPSDLSTVVVVDPWPLVRVGIGRILPRLSCRVVAEASGAAEVEGVVRRHRPGLVIAGHQLGGEQAAVVEASKHLGARVLVLVDRVAKADIEALAVAGVDGIMPAGAAVDELAGAVCRVLAGERVLDPSLVMVLAGALPPEETVEAGHPATGLGALTDREREVLAWLTRGVSNEEIARRLYLSPATVKTHLTHIYAKLGVANRHQATRRAAELGFLG